MNHDFKCMNKLKLKYREDQFGIGNVPKFIFNWIKNFDGATIDFSDTHLKVVPVVVQIEQNESYPLLSYLRKKEDDEYVKSGPLETVLEKLESNPSTITYIGKFSNGWKFRFTTINGILEILNNPMVLDYENAICISDNRTGGWQVYFDLTKSS